MVLVALVPVLALMIVTAALAWGWPNGTLHTTEQERFDMEFERIVRRLDSPTC